MNINPSSDETPKEIDIKYNEATPLRPEGDRLIDAPLVLMDLNSFQKQIKDEKSWKEGDRNAITLYKSDAMRVVLISLHAGAKMPTHTAPGTISVHLLEGHISFETEQRTAELKKGQMLTLHPRVPHSVFAKKESTFLLTMAIQ